MYELSVKNKNGETLYLSGNSDYTVYKVDGLNPPKATINSSVNATQDGSKVNSARVENRNLVLYIAIENDVEVNRIDLYKYFPLKQTITVYFKNDTRDVYIEGVVEAIECDYFSQRQVAQVSLICTQPYFVSVEEFINSFSDISKGFSFPFSISKAGIELSSMTANIRKSIVYTGDVETGVTMELYAIGDVVNPVVYDVQQRTHIKLMFTMRQSDKIVINTHTGNKSIKLIRDGVETNALGYMYPDSTWLQLRPGDNLFTYDCDSGNANLQINIRSSILYGGV